VGLREAKPGGARAAGPDRKVPGAVATPQAWDREGPLAFLTAGTTLPTCPLGRGGQWR
jgi:hypothetical protein